ncbi:MAG: glycoside hydrolase family 88 protein [Bacteroidetes bacterium]|nr:glycoside hydrolase family 88 protein [Bacteroidota bacterium]
MSETDSAGRIYRIRNGLAEIWLQDTLLALTNGLLVRGNALLAGVNSDNFLKSIDLNTRAIHKLAHLGPGNIDGIQETPDGLLVSHFLGNLYAIDAEHQVKELLNTRTQDIFMADFAFLPVQQLLVVPSLRTNKVYLYRYAPEMPNRGNQEKVARPAQTTGHTWVDSLDDYARNKFLPAKKYNWTWQQAPLLRAMTAQYEHQVGPDPAIYLAYVRRAIDKSMDAVWAGHNPNGVASGASLAWLARITGEAKYRTAAEQLYQKYLQIPRMPNGAIWHLKRFAELWDDTVFMVGTYLLEMYLLTDDEKYLDELLLQVQTHREKLQVTDPNAAGAGLWVHGWDGDDKDHCRLCSQQHWDENAAHRSTEIWGRGNGWSS